MKYLFSAAGEAALAELLARPTLLAFDFDGTLAPIVTQPQDAVMPDENRQLLATLCALRPVAIISGRSVADLKQRIGVEPKYLIGNHGLEGIATNDNHLAECALTCQSWHQQLASLLAQNDLGSGVILEDKTYSLSLHYRRVQDTDATANWLRTTLASLTPAPDIIGGKMVFNLMPARSANKRRALESLLLQEGLEHTLFAGDDDTDETIFADAPDHWLTVRVESSATSAARFFLHSQNEMAMLLRKITQFS